MSEKFDVIVVGAGLAGTSAAYTLAKAGLNVIVVERGDFPGAKNVMGGVLYRQPLEKVIPGWWREAPVERPITDERIYLLTSDGMVQVGYKNGRLREEPYHAFTVLRAKFDRWFADKAVQAGALLVTETVAEDVIRDHRGQIIGVRTNRPDGDIYADVVIAADGVNSLLSKKAGLHSEWRPDQVALATKEIIALSREKIEDRFNLEAGEGAAIEFFGEATLGMLGYGFIYTNSDSLSVGVGVLLSELIKRKMSPNELQERFKAHPMVRKLLEGGEVKEYMAHLIPEGGYNSVPPVYADGMLVVGDAAMLVNGLFREGSNYAAISGKLAAQTVLYAREKRDFSAATLKRYRALLEDSFIIKDLKSYSRISRLAHQRPELLTEYPKLLFDAVHEIKTVDCVPKRDKLLRIGRMFLKRRGAWNLVRDLAGALRAIP